MGWVKSHIGIKGNEKANKDAKGVAEEAAIESRFILTGGRIRQWVKEQTKIGMKED